MNTKHTPHTPGPWHTGGRGDRIIYAADGYAVASATVFHNQHDGQLEANARLIAAAPELLEAAIKVNALSIQSDAHRELRAAISKAIGTPRPRFENTYCSQCGGEFGPGNHGFSHCADHRKATGDQS